MSKQFDALLDFGDDPPPSTNGTTAQQSNGGDDFDPFGPQDSGKGGNSDGGLLLDFSVSTEVSNTKNGIASSDPFDTQFSLNSSSDLNNSSAAASNPFSDMSSTDDQPSANPLYDLMDADLNQQQAEDSSVNPLYDLSADNTNSDLTFETNVTTTTTTEENNSANPLYDLMDQEQDVAPTETSNTSSNLLDMDFGPAIIVEKSTPSEDIVVEANNSYGTEDQVVPDLAVQQEAAPKEMAEEGAGDSFDQNVELFIREEGEDAAAEAEPVADVEMDSGHQEQQEEEAIQQQEEVAIQQQVEEVIQQQEEEVVPQQEEEVVLQQEEEVMPQVEEQQHTDQLERPRSRSRSPSRHSISSEGEVLNEEEDMRQDERALYLSQQDEPPSQEASEQPSASSDHTDFGGAGDAHIAEKQVEKDVFEQETPQEQHQQPLDIRQEVSSAEGGVYESEPAASSVPQWEEDPEEGVYENEPEQRADVVRETDRSIGAELPSVGTAKSMRDKFVSGQMETSSSSPKRESTPPAAMEGGVFENEPQYNPDVVHSGKQNEDEVMPEQGTARNMAARFKEMEKQGAVPVPSPGKREITPDRSGKVEYVSEPRGHVDKYEPEVQAGVFESQPAERDDVVKSDQLAEEVLPEKGSAKNMAARFKQMSTDSPSNVPRGKRELTPDTSGRVEFVSEPTGFVEKYEGRTESGVFESQPADREDVIKSDQLKEEIMPEQGTTKNIAARFREMEKTTKSPPSPNKVKEFTPPRENGASPPSAGVYESNPQVSEDVVQSGEQLEEVLPEKGMAKNIANRFRQLSTGDNTPVKSPRSKKEFTPPPGDAGVYENNPKQFIPDYNKPAESGILESKPESRDDVVRSEDAAHTEQELPEQGYTKNLLSAWRQKESEHSKKSPPSSGRPKEFTPPREEPRVSQQRPAPRTPKSPQAGTDMNDGSVHPTDLPGQYQPQAEATVFESQPERRDDVLREDDTDWNAGMPKVDTTKKMLAKFQHIQQQAGATSNTTTPTKPKPTARKEGEDRNSRETTPDQVGRSKSMRVAVQLEKCGACQKTVYVMEKIEIEKLSYHKSCFRCSHCHCILTPKTFAINKNVMFCTNHYKQLFATKGNYDEGFGRDQHKKRWKSEPNLADEELSCNDTAHH